MDEVGELPPELQRRLLNALENKTFHRMGASENSPPRDCNVRLVAATHCDLKEMVSQKLFREDLYYRLHESELTVPRLRERGEDVVRLAERLLADLSRSRGDSSRQLTPAARRAIASYDWPGNVRQLIGTLNQACTLAQGLSIDVQDLGAAAGSLCSTTGPSTVLPPAPDYVVRSPPTAPQLCEADAPSQKQIETFLISFLRHWHNGAGESADALLAVLGHVGGGKPGKWLRYFRQGLLAGIGDAIEQNKLGDKERLELRDAILKEAGSETGRDAWAVAAARLLGAGAKAQPLVKKSKKVVGISL